MSTKTIPAHSEIEPKYTWNAPSVFPSDEAWDAEVASVAHDLAGLKAYQGRLADGPDVLVEAVAAVERLMQRVFKLYTYAGMAYAVNTTDQAAAKRNGRAQGLFGQTAAAAPSSTRSCWPSASRRCGAGWPKSRAWPTSAITWMTSSANRRTFARPRWRSCWGCWPIRSATPA